MTRLDFPWSHSFLAKSRTPSHQVYGISCQVQAFIIPSLWYCFNADTKEFCQFDSFSGRCAENEIIVIERAFYGRMKVGRCISGEGYTGCETDVRTYMDGACAGRHQCNVTVTSLTEVVQPCRKDYTSYLEVAYSCKEGKSI